MSSEPPSESVVKEWEDDWDDDCGKRSESVDDDIEQVRARKNS
jgi:hypothetical protein